MSSPRLVLAENPSSEITIDDHRSEIVQALTGPRSLYETDHTRELRVWAWITAAHGRRRLRKVPLRDIIIVRDDQAAQVPA